MFELDDLADFMEADYARRIAIAGRVAGREEADEPSVGLYKEFLSADESRLRTFEVATESRCSGLADGGVISLGAFAVRVPQVLVLDTADGELLAHPHTDSSRPASRCRRDAVLRMLQMNFAGRNVAMLDVPLSSIHLSSGEEEEIDGLLAESARALAAFTRLN